MTTDIMIEPISYDWAAFIIRWAIGLALLPFPIKKFFTRDEEASKFFGVMFFTPEISFYLAMIMEFLVSVMFMAGFFTRFIAIPGIVTMGIATKYTKGKYFTSPAQAFLLGIIAVLIIGPGKYSLDWLIF